MATTTIERPDIAAPVADWLVYGDALQEAGDPRGELISLVNGVTLGTIEHATRDAFIAKHAVALLGPAGARLAAYRLTWHFCLIDTVDVMITPDTQSDAVELVQQLLASPAARELRAITLVGIATPGKPVDLAPAMEFLAASELPARCDSFGFVDERATQATMLVSRDFDPAQNLVRLGPIEPFWKRAAHVRIDVADAHQLELGTINAPRLRTFALRGLRYGTSGEEPSPLSAVFATATFPHIESFELRLTETWFANIPLEDNPYVAAYSADDESDRYDEADEGENLGTNWTELAGLLATLAAAPHLHRLALTSFDSTTEFLEALAVSGLAASLKELDLSDSSLTTKDARWIAEHASMFAKLERIVVERTSLDAAAVELLRAIGPQIVHSTGAGAHYRFMVGSE